MKQALLVTSQLNALPVSNLARSREAEGSRSMGFSTNVLPLAIAKSASGQAVELLHLARSASWGAEQ